jgi:hypothetical protein
MITALICIAVGIVIGWHVPQPSWAITIQDKLVSKFKK